VAKDPTVEILHITPGQAASIGWRVRVPKSPWYFGLSPSGPIANRTRVGVVITIDPRKVPEEEVKNAKQWLSARLKESGCDDSVLRITQEVVTFRRSDGAEIAVRSENDKIFDLH